MENKKKIGFDKRIIRGVLIILLTLMIIMMGSSYIVVRQTTDDRINREISATLSYKSEEFNRWIDMQENTVAYYGDSVQQNYYTTTRSTEELEDFMATKLTDYTLDYYIIIPNTGIYFASKTKLPPEFDITTREWYVQTLEAKGEYTCSSPYIDYNTQKLVLTIARAFYKENGELDFVIGADIYADKLIEITSSVSIFNNAYPILTDSNFNILVHSNEDFMPATNSDGSEMITTSLKDIEAYGKISDMLSGSDYNAIRMKDYDGETKYFIPYKISSTNWYYLYAVNSIEYNNQISGIVIVMASTFVIAIVLAAVIMTYIIRSSLKPISELKSAVSNMSRGNLEYAPTYNANDSICELCNSLAATEQVWIGYINDINDNLEKMSHGNFDMLFNGEYVGDFAKIKESIIGISKSLDSIIGGINSASDQVARGSDNVSQSSNSLAQGVNDQSRTIDELTELIKNLVEQIDANAKAAEMAQHHSEVTSENVTDCNKRMNELVNSMNDINEKAQEIVKIVKAIDDIAFQTNILALNAAVEAARAGEAGKGFAVVADEVRNLASKCAEAVSSTTALIDSTGEAVNKGTKLAAETENALNIVSDGVNDVNNLIEQISRSSEIQAQEVKDVNSKIISIEEIVKFTASTAEESAASSEELTSQSKALRDMVLNFKR